jgi:hypothetical protein
VFITPLTITCFIRLINGLYQPKVTFESESITFIATLLQMYTVWFIVHLIVNF